jgi:TusA-related sulfurtransferase
MKIHQGDSLEILKTMPNHHHITHFAEKRIKNTLVQQELEI